MLEPDLWREFLCLVLILKCSGCYWEDWLILSSYSPWQSGEFYTLLSSSQETLSDTKKNVLDFTEFKTDFTQMSSEHPIP